MASCVQCRRWGGQVRGLQQRRSCRGPGQSGFQGGERGGSRAAGSWRGAEVRKRAGGAGNSPGKAGPEKSERPTVRFWKGGRSKASPPPPPFKVSISPKGRSRSGDRGKKVQETGIKRCVGGGGWRGWWSTLGAREAPDSDSVTPATGGRRRARKPHRGDGPRSWAPPGGAPAPQPPLPLRSPRSPSLPPSQHLCPPEQLSRPSDESPTPT